MYSCSKHLVRLSIYIVITDKQSSDEIVTESLYYSSNMYMYDTHDT